LDGFVQIGHNPTSVLVQVHKPRDLGRLQLDKYLNKYYTEGVRCT